MRSFTYLRDRLFWIACLAYLANNLWIKPTTPTTFWHFYFNDLWLIPCALPPVLYLHRRLGLRSNDKPPSVAEVFGHLIFWSVLFEWVGPHLVTKSTGDRWDVLAYTLGAVIAALWWNRGNWSARFSRA